MDENIQEKSGSRGFEKGKILNSGFLILLLIVADLSIISVIISGIARPDQAFSSLSYFLGGVTGTFLIIYFISLLSFAFVRLIRDGSAPLAGLGTGIATALLLFAIASHDDAELVVQHFVAAFVENIESLQR